YKKNENFEIKAYIDVDWAGSLDHRKSTNGGGFFLGNKLVSWTSKKQKCILQSTVEAKNVVSIVNCSIFFLA
ncbi:Ty1/Copia family ribonuclease HI, partial [Mycobacterium kansasii]